MVDEHTVNAEELGHEPTTVNVRSVSIAVAVLFGVIAASLLLMAGLGSLLASREGGEATVRPPGTLVAPPAGIPAVDANQMQTLQELRGREATLLGTYEWVDRDEGVARIPIGRAMEILAEQPLNDSPNTEATDEDMAAR